MTLIASLLLSTLPQVFPGGDLKLPPRRETPAAQAPVRPVSEIERFRRDLIEMQAPSARVEAKLQAMAQTYKEQAIEPLILEVARSARATEMQNLLPVIKRFAATSPRVADELQIQLLSRPLAEATRPVLETMAAMKGPEAKQALCECVRGRIAGVRRQAAEVLIPLLTAEDLPFAVQLSREQSLDLQLRGIELLRAMPEEAAAQRLVELLSKDPALAGSACAALVQQGRTAVAPLQKLLAEPAIDRGFTYGAFALAQIAQRDGAELLPEALVAPLSARLAEGDALARCLAAVPLADLTFRGAVAPASDVAIVDALLEVVQPLVFVLSIDLLRRPAEERLLRTTGRIVAAGEALPWRDWWKDQRSDFLGVRARVTVDAGNAAAAIVTLRHEQRQLRLLAEGHADAPPVADAKEVVLTAAQMIELVAALQAGGFADEQAMRVDSGLPRGRSLQVRVPGGRAQVVMPLTEHAQYDALVAMVERTLDAELWQLYRDPQAEPDRGAFWRTERRWRDENPDEAARGRRFVARVVRNWATLVPALRARAIEQIAAHPQRKELLSEEDGERAVEVLAAQPELTELDRRLLELAASVPGDQVWRRAVELAARQKGGGPGAVRAVFAVLGPDAVLSALRDPNAMVRRAGIAEIMVVRDQRAGPRLVELLADADLEVRVAAAGACGHLQLAASSRPLVAAIAADDTPPVMRRECLRALGRVGGEMAFPVLQRALTSPSAEDKEAALRGLGDLKDPRAAYLLAEMIVVGHGRDLGMLARFNLTRQGGTHAVPALRAQLEIVQDATIHSQLVLLLGAYNDAANVPALMDLLRNPRLAPEAAAMFSGTTGIDLVAADDRINVAESWWRRHKTEMQWQWLLEALRASSTPTALRPEHVTAGAGLAPVVELSRLLVEVREPRLWALTSAVLRTVAKEDFGAVGLLTTLEAREAVAARYRVLAESARAAQGR